MPIFRVPGPLHTITGPTGIVVASTPCMLNSSLQTASTAVSTQGRCSGRHPAITAAIATFSTVTSTRSGGTVATTSCGSRDVPVSMRNTRFGRWDHGQAVGPTALEHQLELVLGVGDVDPSRAQHVAVVDGAELVDAVGVDAHRAAAGSHRGQVESEPEDAGEIFPLGAQPPDGAADLLAVDDVDQRGHGLDLVVPAQREVGVVDRAAGVRGSRGRPACRR